MSKNQIRFCKYRKWVLELSILILGMLAARQLIFYAYADSPALSAQTVSKQILIVYSNSEKKNTMQVVARAAGSKLKTVGKATEKLNYGLAQVDNSQSLEEVIQALESNPKVVSAQPNYIYTSVETNQVEQAEGGTESQSYLNTAQLPSAMEILGNTAHSSVKTGLVDDGYGLPKNLAMVLGDVEELVHETVKPVDQNYTTASLVAAIYKVRNQGVSVLDINFYGVMNLTGQKDELMEQVIADAVKAGILVTAPTGNDQSEQHTYPADLDGVLGVISLTADGNSRADFSNFGSEKNKISAPSMSFIHKTDSGTEVISKGTASSTDLVAGVAALIWSVNPQLALEQVKQLLCDTTSDIYVTGYDDLSGSGCINAKQALSMAIMTNPNLKPESIHLEETVLEMAIGEGHQLQAWITPDTACQIITWNSSDPQVLQVDQKGYVTAVSSGYAAITALTVSGQSVVCSVRVTDPAAVTQTTQSQPTDSSAEFVLETEGTQASGSEDFVDGAPEDNTDMGLDLASADQSGVPQNTAVLLDPTEPSSDKEEQALISGEKQMANRTMSFAVAVQRGDKPYIIQYLILIVLNVGNLVILFAMFRKSRAYVRIRRRIRRKVQATQSNLQKKN